MPFAKPDAEPVYLTQMKALLKRHPKTTIIWAHIGLGRIVHPVQVSAQAAERSPNQVEIVEAMLTDPALEPRELRHLVGRGRQVRRRVAGSRLTRGRDCSTGIPIGSCSAPTRSRRPSAAAYFAVFDMWAPVWQRLTPDASQKVRKGNYERLFDEGATARPRVGESEREMRRTR